MTSSVFVSVVRGWRYADAEGRLAVTDDVTGHRALMGEVHGGGRAGDPFRLPWPPFPSRFWSYHLGRRDYPKTRPYDLVRLLVPRRALLRIDYGHQLSSRAPLAEVFVLPFGVWTALTVDLAGTWDDDRSIADDLDDAMLTQVTGPAGRIGQLRDGLTHSAVDAALREVPWSGVADLVDAGTVILCSGLSAPVADVTERAPWFRTRFQSGGGGVTHELHQLSAGASSTTTTQIGITLADTSRRSPSRIKCLHHNHSLLIGHLLTFGELLRADPVAEATVYREWAARVLHHLHRGERLHNAGVYKSWVAPAWIEETGLVRTINEVTAELRSDRLPPLEPAASPAADTGDSDDD